MADTSNMITTPAPEKETDAPEGGFALNMDWQGPSCEHCGGRSRMRVTDERGTIVGYLESEHHWADNIPDDITEHPQRPHYVMDWIALDPDRNEVPGLGRKSSLHFMALALLRRSQQQN